MASGLAKNIFFSLIQNLAGRRLLLNDI